MPKRLTPLVLAVLAMVLAFQVTACYGAEVGPVSPEELERGRDLIVLRDLDKAIPFFKELAEKYPHSDYAYGQLGELLFAKYKKTNSEADLRDAANALVRSCEIGMASGKLRHTALAGKALATLGDEETLRTFFTRVIDSGYDLDQVAEDYAMALEILQAPDTEEWFIKATELQRPKGLVAAWAHYAEFLLTQGQYDKVLDVIPADIPVEDHRYLHFLRGVALEQLGNSDEAKQEYQYYEAMSQDFPIESRFRIEGSTAQEGLTFDDVGIQATTCTTEISRCIYCEARGESKGSMRAVGWTIRDRVFNNSTSNSCLNFGITGSTTCDKYISAINRGFCACADGCATNADTNNAASDVYYGRTPEPFTKWCPYGYYHTCDKVDPIVKTHF